MNADSNQEPKVFISSTGEDLVEYRKAVRDLVLQCQCGPRMYELAVTDSHTVCVWSGFGNPMF